MKNKKSPKLDCENLLSLLNEAYIFVAMKHRACDPWRKALNDWQARVEKQTGWSAFEQIEKSVGVKNGEKQFKPS